MHVDKVPSSQEGEVLLQVLLTWHNCLAQLIASEVSYVGRHRASLWDSRFRQVQVEVVSSSTMTGAAHTYTVPLCRP